jgi:hypothetical protein
MRKIMALLLALCLLTACGDKTASISEVEETEIQTFGVSTVSEASEVPEPSTEPTQESETLEEPESAAESEETERSQDLTELTIRAVLYCDYVDAYYYQKDDPVYFWRAVSILVGLVGEQYPASTVEGDLVTIAAQDIEPFVTALFGEYTEQYPSVGEENPVVYATYQDGQEVYHVIRRDMSDFEMEWEGKTEGDTLYCTATVRYGGETAGYHLTFREDPDWEGPFYYSLETVERD